MPLLSSVLLVDDDPATNFLNERLLKRLGVADNILVARNGEEALVALAQACGPMSKGCPVLMLLDINVPVMNGIEFLEAYQPSLPAHSLVVIALTTIARPADLIRLQELSIADIVTKPLTEAKIESILRKHF